MICTKVELKSGISAKRRRDVAELFCWGTTVHCDSGHLTITGDGMGTTVGTRRLGALISNQYRIVPNVTYLKANNWDAKLDLYLPRNQPEPSPTLIYFHGGGWVRGAKEASVLRLLPYLEMGWTVVKHSRRQTRALQPRRDPEKLLHHLRVPGQAQPDRARVKRRRCRKNTVNEKGPVRDLQANV